VTLRELAVPPAVAREAARQGHESVHLFDDADCGYLGVIALHGTARGPGLGGTRAWRYPGPEEAALDALRLARGMTAKITLAGMPFGGGKSVIALPEAPFDREEVYRAHGRAVESLGGRYVTAADVGTGVNDLRAIRRQTRWVVGLGPESGRSGWWTARGVLHAIRAALRHRHGSPSLVGRTVAVQGAGSVGGSLAEQLAEAGARVLVGDIDAARAAKVAAATGGRTVASDVIHEAEADVFAPCALGGVLDLRRTPELAAPVVAGGANNQLAEDADLPRLMARGITWVPDYVANAGGVITAGTELLGWDVAEVRRRVEAIEDTTGRVLALADAEEITPLAAAERLAAESGER
jgi:leucine dehydrogenase